MSADWQGFMEWLMEEGASDPGAARERLTALASTSDHADTLAMILGGAQHLQVIDLLNLVAGVAFSMTQIEWAPQADNRRRQLVAALQARLYPVP